MADAITWTPRSGASSDDRYNAPGAIGLDGTLRPGEPESIKGGLPILTGLSTSTPTVAQVNADRGFGQIALEALRWYDELVSAGLSTGTVTRAQLTNYLYGQDSKMFATYYTQYRSYVPTLRARFGLSAASFGAFNGSARAAAVALAELRKGLTFNGSWQAGAGGVINSQWQRDMASGAAVWASYGNWFGEVHVGTVYGFGKRFRYAKAYYVPTMLGDASRISTLSLTFSNLSVSGAPTLDIILLPSTTSTITAATLDEVGTTLTTVTPTVGTFVVNMLPYIAHFVSRAGSHFKIVVAESAEYVTPYSLFPPNNSVRASVSGGPTLSAVLA